MSSLNEHLIELQEIISVELSNAQELKGEKLEKFKSMFYIDWELEGIYYTPTNLILTHEKEFKRIMEMNSNFTLVMKNELPDFCMFVYVLNYTQIEQLDKLLEEVGKV